MFLSGKARHVHLLVRKDSLRETMSVYLLDRIERTPNITVHYGCETEIIGGADQVETVTFRNRKTDHRTILPVSDIYVMIGATPNCGFIHGLCQVDDHGFIVTDDFFQTSMPRLYAVGDVRAGSVKRVANAAGEGATSIKWLWQALHTPKLETA
ncbi:NAD(P)/FAD-dependent oxidoreductase [Sphingomonas sp. J315]|nr:NAD(P)/FAD-dependent oxidoreductase [Sphingomonas sp. J315]